MNTEATLPRRVTLVTGPARSGKSEWAETLAAQTGTSVIYVATAQRDPGDVEWQTRIEQHQCRRPAGWRTLEVPVELPATIRSFSQTDTCLLVDSLGTWVANLLDQDVGGWEKTLQDLLTSLDDVAGEVIFVAEETGWGVVPAYPLGRTFRDRLGQLVRRLGAIANPVYLVTGGHVLNLCVLGSPLPMPVLKNLPPQY
ncbi:MAG: bifunctional adenosylcobinamide kinase/adenosylcobinamide-phosphate guanylyltransferase [Microcoleus vaginatus WJT46-NPBG5]|jgi:adenosylcobinamide kinase/adenosylcobinamide-phosphate guanylyltransferase|nr:bifunctional adenosylcobinamide kinase/adenosylcobinamide-phosphate guanylyltransferase [Microcoleus vaginatus WJT46-NPBG5]